MATGFWSSVEPADVIKRARFNLSITSLKDERDYVLARFNTDNAQADIRKFYDNLQKALHKKGFTYWQMKQKSIECGVCMMPSCMPDDTNTADNIENAIAAGQFEDDNF